MSPRKRNHDEMHEGRPAEESPSLLHRVRSTWEFACLMQYIYIFGKAVKIDEELDVDLLESECIRPTHSVKLSEIGLALLKCVSSHKGLTPDIFDEYTRRQFLAKAPERNPFGVDEVPLPFAEMDIFVKLRVLHQLSVWTLGNPERIREKMPERDAEQTNWRIEPLGWDSQRRSYFLLDDDRLYRRTEPNSSSSTLKTKSKAKAVKVKGGRASKRRKLSVADTEEVLGEEEGPSSTASTPGQDDGLGGAHWECIAVTLDEYQDFLDTIRRSRDADEKILLKRIAVDALPVIEKKAEAQERKAAQRQRQLENEQKLATAKRSSRIASKMDKEKEAREAETAERKHREDLAMAHREQERKERMEQDRESRMMTREQRIKEREVKRILHEEQLARLERESSQASVDGRISERQRNVEMKRRKEELAKLNRAEGDWDFDCSLCGVHGKNLDDGTHSVACEKCNVWQHSACHGIDKSDAERDDFHFVCRGCSKPVSSIKLHIRSSSSPDTQKTINRAVSSPADRIAIPHTNGVLPHYPSSDHTNHFPLKSPAVLIPASINGTLSQKSSQYPPMGTFHVRPHSQASHGPTKLQPPHVAQGPGRPTSAKSNGTHVQSSSKISPSTTIQNHYAMSTEMTRTPHPQQQPFSSPSDPFSRNVTSHNPFLNHFGRQRPASAQSNTSFPSPTPSLSATQGNTGVHFSPTHLANGAGSNAYITITSSPAASAYSPTKNPSHPSQPMLLTPQVPVMSPAGLLPRPLATGSQSPTKDNGVPLTLTYGLSHEPKAMEGRSSNGELPSSPNMIEAFPPASTMTLPRVSSLTPTINADYHILQPPMKKSDSGEAIRVAY